MRKTENVAVDLLGKLLVSLLPNGERLSGRIIETEAYLGLSDPACHSFGGRKTPRVRSMYEEGGVAYIYFVYGLHYCFNVVTQSAGVPEAVLIRALEPIEGVQTMKLHRQQENIRDLTSGPAKICQALQIDRSLDGHRLNAPPLWIEEVRVKKNSRPSYLSTKRTGISSSAGEAALWPLRFLVCPEAPYTSDPPKRR